MVVELFLIFVIFITSVGLLVSLSNMRAVRRLGEHNLTESAPKVSILVPARNEERNIKACVSSLLTQDYPNFEVLVLDDNSTDATPLILNQLKRANPRLKVINGAPLPEGWPGKHWACHQLSQQASGDYLLFTDADTRHEPDALSSAIAEMLHSKADLLTALPRQEVRTWSEKLLVPFMNFGILSFLPIKIAQVFKIPELSVTIGQFMLFRREAYQAVGGYAAAIVNVNDDVILGRMIIENSYKWVLSNGSDQVTCRMYHNFHETVEGFSKNVFGFFGYKVIPFTFVWTLAFLIFTLPVWILFRHLTGMFIPPALVDLSVIAAVESLALFLIAYHRQRIPIYLAFFYPLTIAAFATIALRSMVLTVNGHASWKGRELMKADVKWL